MYHRGIDMMTIPTNRNDYVGDGSTTAFVYAYTIFSSSDLEVYVNGVLKTSGADYRVSGVGSVGGGKATFMTAPAAGAKVAIVRAPKVSYGSAVSASADGRIHKIFGLTRSKGDNLPRCPGTSPTWERAPSKDGDGGDYGGANNHGYGIVVILKHANGKYSLYGHLDCVEPGLAPGDQVKAGRKIGEMGDSVGAVHRGSGGGIHLHFEINDRGVLGTDADSGNDQYWGYTPDLPGGYGHHDPREFIDAPIPEPMGPLTLRVVDGSSGFLTARSGPGKRYPVLARLGIGHKFVADQRHTVGSETWYRVYFPGHYGANAVWLAARHSDCSNGVCAVEEPGAARITVVADKAQIRTGPGTTNLPLEVWDNHKDYQRYRRVHLWKDQRFAVAGPATPGNDDPSQRCAAGLWYPVYLPSPANPYVPTPTRSQGWVCADLVTEEHVPGNRGLATALVLDVSGSMEWGSGSVQGKRKIDLALEAARVFAKGGKEDEQISLSTFASAGATPVLMSRKHDAVEKLGTFAPVAQGGTNIGAGLDEAHRELTSVENRAGRKVGVLLSDGVNTVGDWRPALERFRDRKWKVYTVGFITDEKALEEARKKYGGQISADDYSVFSKTLFEIALRTGGVYYPAGSENVEHVFDRIRNLVNDESSLLYASEWLKVGEELAYRVLVTQAAEVFRVFTSTVAGELKTVLVSPDGRAVLPETLAGLQGRYEKGNPFQIIEVNRPQKGAWVVKVNWAKPPPGGGGQVNLSVTERSDIVGNLLAFKPTYGLREAVGISVYAVERQGDQEIPLRNVQVVARIRKPGPDIVQGVQAGTGSWVMYKDAIQNNTRELTLHDDGRHEDYAAGDGIYANTFGETDVNGPYIVTAEITGLRRSGEKVTKVVQGSFQVGPIALNRITISRELDWLEKLAAGAKDLKQEVQDRPTQPAKETENLLEQPAKETEHLLGDPQKQIQKLLGN
jgi:hypothetical protein